MKSWRSRWDSNPRGPYGAYLCTGAFIHSATGITAALILSACTPQFNFNVGFGAGKSDLGIPTSEQDQSVMPCYLPLGATTAPAELRKAGYTQQSMPGLYRYLLHNGQVIKPALPECEDEAQAHEDNR